MPGATKRNTISICGLLIVRLEANGGFDTGVNGGWAACGGIGRLRYTLDVLQGDNIREPDGCGGLAVVRRYPDRVTGVTMEIEMLTHSHEMFEIATDADLITESGSTVGHADTVDVSCGSATPKNGVAVIAYAENWGCDEANELPYEAHIFPRAYLVPGQNELTRGVNRVTLSGWGQPNRLFGVGPFAEFPGLSAHLGGWAHAAYDTDALPACDEDLDYITIPTVT